MHGNQQLMRPAAVVASAWRFWLNLRMCLDIHACVLRRARGAEQHVYLICITDVEFGSEANLVYITVLAQSEPGRMPAATR